ncbi:phagosome assembly factor 1-like [Watersipora subatra]|uniref:phagosome assembly factor 1-like n=1 Tax=Watersipora subatra TaxID=2589382 RepID=UPI00355C9EA1
MLELEVTLSSLLNNKLELSLGCPFCHSVSVLQQYDKEITQIEVWYSDENPLGNDLVLNLSNDGIKLIFDPYSQRVKMIEVYEMDKVSLRYHGKLFNSPSVSPTIQQISQSFGATIPCTPVLDENRQMYVMNFRGLAFYFASENATANVGWDEDTGPSYWDMKVIKMQIYRGSSAKTAQAPELPINLYTGVALLEKAQVQRSNNHFTSLDLTLKVAPARLDASEYTILSRQIVFGLSCQEVASRLGAPTRIFHKSDDKMKIHSSNPQRWTTTRTDCIYNYFSLGMDLIFDGYCYKLKKLVLHTNYPGHYDFNIYTRCNFTIPLSEHMELEHRMANPYQSDQLTVTPFTKWVDIQPFGTRPKSVSVTRKATINSSNPFEQTTCYGVQDMIFEVMKNKHIGSVVIYQI